MTDTASEKLTSQLDALLKSARAVRGIFGIGVQVSWQGRRFGAADGFDGTSDTAAALTVRSRFQLNCVSTLPTAALAFVLSRRGELDLDAAVSHYLPQLRGTRNGDEVKVWHLMCHVTGHAGPADDAELLRCATNFDALIEQVANSPRLFAPGTVPNYEVADFWLLNRVIGAASGAHPCDLFYARIAAPLGIASTSASATRQTVPTPWGLDALRLSAAELVELCDAIVESADPSSRWHELFGPACDAMFTPRIRLPAFLGIDPYHQAGFGYSLGCAEFAGDFFGHNGSSGGECAAVRVNPRQRLAIALYIGGVEPLLRDEIVRRIVSALSPASGRPRVPDAIRCEDPQPYVGTFIGSRLKVDMEIRNDELICEVFDAGRSQGKLEILYKAGDGEWYVTPKAARSPLRLFSVAATSQRAIMIGGAALLKA